jgi:L-seryl-tRNA(Ser) seleniumtransferase
LPSFAVAFDSPQPDELARALRLGEPPVVARVNEGRLLLDMRTVLPGQEAALEAALAMWAR